jgi:hypothetical protein
MCGSHPLVPSLCDPSPPICGVHCSPRWPQRVVFDIDFINQAPLSKSWPLGIAAAAVVTMAPAGPILT